MFQLVREFGPAQLTSPVSLSRQLDDKQGSQEKERGIALNSLEEQIDTSSAAGELVFHVFGGIAHFERRLISERTSDGVAAAKAKGKRPGRKPLDQAKVDAAMTLIRASTSPAQAARQFGLGRSTVYREKKRLGVSRSD